MDDGRALGDLLRVLVTIDSVVQQNAGLSRAWAQYKRLIELARGEPGRFGVGGEEGSRLAQLEEALVRLDHALLSGAVFQGCIEQVRSGGVVLHKLGLRGRVTCVSQLTPPGLASPPQHRTLRGPWTGTRRSARWW